MYETLWIDQDTAQTDLQRLYADPGKGEVAQQLKALSENGFSIIQGAVPHQLIDAYLAEFKVSVGSGKLLASYGQEMLPAQEMNLRQPLSKTLDTMAFSEAARAIAFAPKIKAFLDALFEEPALAFQSLHFEVGSTQAVHNDTAYVVVDEPKSLCAIWVALEDIAPGTGELVYYPGSHRFNDFLYGDQRKNWSQSEDGNQLHDHHLFWIHEEAKRRGVPLQTFRPKKGDVLFWHADLCHGGGPITDLDGTRRSLVVHYCPLHCTPHYFQFLPPERRRKVETEQGGYMSSFFYPV